jgi:hypothetical protein
MASPFLIMGSYNALAVPFLWWLLAFVLLVIGIVKFSSFDQRASKYAIGIFFLIFILLWAVLDLRNNTYYLKAISRDASLYWGKSLEGKRGIVIGDPEFVAFMKFCDENIPLDGRIFDLVPDNLAGTPPNYLSSAQFFFNLRPRLNTFYHFSKALPKPYYVLYKSNPKEIRGVEQEQNIMDGYLTLSRGDKLRQEITLWRNLEDIASLSLRIEGGSAGANNLAVAIMAEDGRTKIARVVLNRAGSGEVFFQIVPSTAYSQSRIILEIENRGDRPFGIGVSHSRKYRDGDLYFQGKRQNKDLAFRLDYNIKNLKLFKRYNDEAFILTK